MYSNISNDELISRYIVSKSGFKSSTGEVKYSTYMPMYNEKDDCLETSVFRTDGLKEEEIWHTGEENVSKPRDKTLIGRSELVVQQVKRVGNLAVEEVEPPERHAVIVGWSSHREDQIEQAKDLARAAGEIKKMPE
jgi:hypothetical protein